MLGRRQETTGVRASKYDLIALLDSRMIYMKNKLEEQINVLKKLPPHVGLVYTAIDIYQKGNKRSTIQQIDGF